MGSGDHTPDLRASRSALSALSYFSYIFSIVPQLYSSRDRRGEGGLLGDEVPEVDALSTDPYDSNWVDFLSS